MARWLPPADAARGRPEAVFQRLAWHRHKRDAGRYRVLEWVVDGARLARVALRDVRVPGLYRRWALLGEPDWVGAPGDARAALADLLDAARAEGVDVVDCQFNMARWPPEALPPGAEAADFGTYVVDLRGGLDAVVQGLSSGHRRDWRRGLRDGLETRERVHPAEFIALLRETYAHGDKALPFSEAYLRRLLESPAIPTLQVGVYADGALQAAALVPYDARRGWYLHGGVRRPGPVGAAVLAHVDVMARLIERGVPAYDLGGVRPGTTDPRLAGIADFKRRFGGAFEPVARWRVALSARARLVDRVQALR
ncbi:MAG: GNAT family N-acetyltransferase [Myxococcales bacterium]|nr:GNAT family N-acetyltransferase [Myxococcales bacterium]